MIRTRIAGTAAVFTFGLAALGGTALSIAGPANAAPSNEHTAGSTSTSSHTGSPSTPSRQAHLIPGFKPSREAHLIPGVKPYPIATGSSNGPTSTVGSTPTSDVSSSGGALTSSKSTDPRIQRILDEAKAGYDPREEAHK
jgi:hypothetical protein